MFNIRSFQPLSVGNIAIKHLLFLQKLCCMGGSQGTVMMRVEAMVYPRLLVHRHHMKICQMKQLVITRKPVQSQEILREQQQACCAYVSKAIDMFG